MNKKVLDPETSPIAAFGANLRRLREERGWTQEDLAARTGYTGTHISAVETGRRPPTQRFATSADRALGTGQRLERQGRSVRDTAILEGFPEYAQHEMHAAEIRIFELSIVPGLLQTRDYALAITQGAVQRGAITQQQAEERMTLLEKRQAALNRAPEPFVYVVLDEGCIRRPVGVPETMSEQLASLIEFAERPNTLVQVAPYTLGERRAFDLPVYLLGMPDRSLMSYAESAHQGRLERELRVVQPLMTAYHQLQAEALSQAASVATLRDVMKGNAP